MSNSWDDMRRAKEDSYFDKKDREALERLSKKKEDKPRLSPITGEPMEQVVIQGVVIDRCPSSKGVWLDAGELEQLMGAAETQTKEGSTWLNDFFKGLTGKGAK